MTPSALLPRPDLAARPQSLIDHKVRNLVQVRSDRKVGMAATVTYKATLRGATGGRMLTNPRGEQRGC